MSPFAHMGLHSQGRASRGCPAPHIKRTKGQIFASPQLAPTAPASTVFNALSSVHQNGFSEFAVQKVNGWG